DLGARRTLAALCPRDRAQQPLGAIGGQIKRLREQRGPLRLAGDPETAIQAGGAGVLAQDGEGERVEGVDRNLGRSVWKQAREPLAHFAGGAAGKRDGEAVFGGYAAL